MRYFLVAVACLLLAIPASAQTALDGGAPCLELGEKANRSFEADWTHSFDEFLGTYQADLSAEQTLLIQEGIEIGSSPSLGTDRLTSTRAMQGLVVDLRKALTPDQLSELLARMGSETQLVLATIGVISQDEIACACKAGSGRGCPDDFPCTVGCTTWGTGEWNGLCKRAAVQVLE
ncbi:MAG: hypothetical protein AAFX50_06130 [Acidobacteriota bacterium]